MLTFEGEMTAAEFEAIRAECDRLGIAVDKLEIQPMTAEELTILRPKIGSQEEVAESMGRARRTIGRWERGERPVPASAALWLRLEAKSTAERKAHTMATAAEIASAK